MKRTFWAWAEESPIILVPLFAVCVGFVFLPFAVAGAEKAAEFYGAFAAAVVAAVAVLGNASYQAHLTRRRDREIRNENLYNDAKALYLWLDGCAQRLDRAAYRLEEFAKRLNSGQAVTTPLNYGNFRPFFSPIDKDEAISYWIIACRLPIQVAQTVSSALAVFLDKFDARNPAVLRDEVPITAADFSYWGVSFRDSSDLMRIAQSHISRVMRESGHVFPIPDNIEQILRRVREKYGNTSQSDLVAR